MFTGPDLSSYKFDIPNSIGSLVIIELKIKLNSFARSHVVLQRDSQEAA
jgi:hypothetical protein